MDVIRNGDEEPVFELGDEVGDQGEDLPERRSLQLDTLLTPDALAFAGLMLAVLGSVSPVLGHGQVLFILAEGPPSKGWMLGPPLAMCGAALALGVSAWRIALATNREVPRLAGATVLLSLAMLVLFGVIWSYEPSSASVGPLGS